MALPEFDQALEEGDLDRMVESARQATDFLKALSHEGRLLILCHLCTGEKSVTELERLLSSRQAAVSQQLARLRLEGLVDHRREGKMIYYRLNDPRVRRMIETIYELFCEKPSDRNPD
ncbi:MAG: transcriptional regulator [Paracoccaceae bacterium]|nr:MAG: ArsR family transcriptional regulator [Alphaproteobacteria bacterium]GIX13743.1 MAG: transcriptional regulator [Paracoccaceae bacterium]